MSQESKKGGPSSLSHPFWRNSSQTGSWLACPWLVCVGGFLTGLGSWNTTIKPSCSSLLDCHLLWKATSLPVNHNLYHAHHYHYAASIITSLLLLQLGCLSGRDSSIWPIWSQPIFNRSQRNAVILTQSGAKHFLELKYCIIRFFLKKSSCLTMGIFYLLKSLPEIYYHCSNSLPTKKESGSLSWIQ